MGDGDIFEHMVDRAEGDGVRRMDVIISGSGRRSWSPDVKARIIAESMVPGANVAEVARRNDMQPQHLYMWRRAAMERMAAGGRYHLAFVPAIVEEAPATPAVNDARGGNAYSPEISVELADMMVRIPERASADHIVHVLRAVRAAS
jgi:transposase